MLDGGSGNDSLDGSYGSDRIDGGAGDDTATFHGNMSGFDIASHGSTVQVTEVASGDADTLTHVEHLAFNDATVDTALIA